MGSITTVAYLVITGLLLASITILSKMAASEGLSPVTLLMWPVIGAALVHLLITALRKRLPPLNARTLEYFIVTALVSVVLPNLIFFTAVSHVGAGFISLTITLPPLLTYAGSVTLGMEKFSTYRLIGVVTALTGAIWLTISKLSAPDGSVYWVLFTLAGPLILAFGNLYRTFRWPEGIRPESLVPGMLVTAAAGVILIVLFTRQTVNLSLLNSSSLPIIIFQTVLFTLFYFFFFLLQKNGGPTYFSLLGSVSALFGVPMAVIFLGESPPKGLVVGAVLIVAGIGTLTYKIPGTVKATHTETIT